MMFAKIIGFLLLSVAMVSLILAIRSIYKMISINNEIKKREESYEENVVDKLLEN